MSSRYTSSTQSPQYSRLVKRAKRHFLIRQYADALPLYQQCLRISEDALPSADTAVLLYTIGLCYFNLRDFLNAAEHFQRVEDDTNLTLITRCNALELLCTALQHCYNFSEAELKCYKAFKLLLEARTAGHSLTDGFDYARLRANVQAILGNVHRCALRPFESLEQYAAALSLYETLGDTASASKVMASMSECYARQGLFDKALETAQRAVLSGGETRDSLSYLGIALRNSEQFDEALVVYRKAQVMAFRKWGRLSSQVADSHFRVGMCLRDLGKLDEALESLSSARSILEELQTDQALYAATLYGLASALFMSNRPSEAKVQVECALEINRRLYSADNSYISDCLRLLADLNSALGNVDAAELASSEATSASRRSQTQCATAGCPRRMKLDGSSLEMCAGCRQTHYCSVECQRADWKTTHKAECKQLQVQHKLRASSTFNAVSSSSTGAASASTANTDN